MKAKVINEDLKLFCNDCSYSCDKEKDTLKHIRIEHMPKTANSKKKKEYSCNLCDFKASVEQNLARHITNTHSKYTYYNCGTCDKSFKYLKCMQKHQVLCQK